MTWRPNNILRQLLALFFVVAGPTNGMAMANEEMLQPLKEFIYTQAAERLKTWAGVTVIVDFQNASPAVLGVAFSDGGKRTLFDLSVVPEHYWQSLGEQHSLSKDVRPVNIQIDICNPLMDGTPLAVSYKDKLYVGPDLGGNLTDADRLAIAGSLNSVCML